MGTWGGGGLDTCHPASRDLWLEWGQPRDPPLRKHHGLTIQAPRPCVLAVSPTKRQARHLLRKE